MLSKIIFNKLNEYLKKYEGPWLTDKTEEDSKSKIRPLGGFSTSKETSESEENLALEAFLKNKKIFFHILHDLKKGAEGKTGKEQKFPELYKKALVSKQIFHKIFDGDFVPSKDTVFKFALALEASVEEAESLLSYAGYAFGDCIKRDLILKFCFENKITELLEVNELLKRQGQRLLVKEAKKNGGMLIKVLE
ncbi:MAG: hypothetical protein LBC85_10305 [Fibromonadaceae bacterium]|jgi:hypothetical protein|nr:hypothetical protein [Fibromonadaceae bacterium]